MRLHSENREVEIVGAIESKTAGLRVNRAMMMMLSKQYSDFEWAIGREYGTNMLDAYVSLRKRRPDAPFIPPIIRLPHTFSPFIEFVDFGIGMDYDTLWNTFTDYGASTKNDDDDEVGGYGIGAKVANYYEKSDVWFVESRYDGVRHIIHITRNKEGIPLYSRMASVPTDEPNGVTVRIPVPKETWPLFHRAVMRLAEHFPLPLTIIGDGAQEIAYKKPEYILQGTGWGIKPGRGKSTVVMGNVPYPLDQQQLTSKTSLASTLLDGYSIDFAIGIGELEITPSRESLIYSDYTVTRLKLAVDTFVDELKAKALKEVESQPDAWSAARLIMQTWSSSALRYALKDVMFKGVKIDVNHGIQYTLAQMERRLPQGTSFTYVTMAEKGVGVQMGVRESHSDNEWHTYPKNGYVPRVYTANPTGLNWVIVDDMQGKAGERRVKYFMQEKLTQINSRGNRARSNRNGYAFLFRGLDVEQVHKAFFGMPVILTSSLPDPPKGEARAKTLVKQFTGHGRYAFSDTNVEDLEGGFYVRLERDNIMEGYDASGLKKLVASAVRAGVFASPPTVYGIPRSCKRLEKVEGWEAIVPYIREEVRKLLQKNARGMAEQRRWEKVMGSNMVKFFRRVQSQLEPGSIPHQLAKGAEVAEARTERYAALQEIATLLALSLPDREAQCDPGALLAQANAMYPMLSIMQSNLPTYSTSFMQEYGNTILTYMNMEDEKREKMQVEQAA